MYGICTTYLYIFVNIYLLNIINSQIMKEGLFQECDDTRKMSFSLTWSNSKV